MKFFQRILVTQILLQFIMKPSGKTKIFKMIQESLSQTNQIYEQRKLKGNLSQDELVYRCEMTDAIVQEIPFLFEIILPT